MKIFTRIGKLVYHFPKTVLIISLLFILITSVGGVKLIPKLSSGGYNDPGSDSEKVNEELSKNFNTKNPWIVCVVEALQERTIDEPKTVQDVKGLVDFLSKIQGVEKINSYWSLGYQNYLKSKDGKAAYIFIYLKPSKIEEANKITKIIENEISLKLKTLPKLKIYVSGEGPIKNAINNRITKDVAFAELIAIPISIILMLIVFGSLIAALTPLVVACFAIPGSLCFLWVLSFYTDLSIFSLNLITSLGLGLGIDYALLIVNRFREELYRKPGLESAILHTVESAGRTVFYSGLTVALTLLSMILFPQYLLKSFAYAGVSAVTLAVVGALFPLPALLVIIGPNINALRIRAVGQKKKDEGWWWRTALFVMRHPWFVIFGTLLLLSIFTLPIRYIKFGQLDERVLPKGEQVVIASKFISEKFTGKEATPIEIVMKGAGSKTFEEAVKMYAKEISNKNEILRVLSSEGIYIKGNLVGVNPLGATLKSKEDLRFIVIANVEARTSMGQELIRLLRSIPPPVPETIIGGAAAEYHDSQMGVVNFILPVSIWIMLATFVIIFLYTGSIILPIKAILLNIQSLAATFGALTWIFLNGNLMGIIGDFTVTGNLDTTSMVLIFVLVFGLSMDYELFLLSRIKEEHDLGANTTSSVALGLQRSAHIITAAALLLAVAFMGTITSGVTSVKLIGLGVVMAILLDATIVRALLMPALMKIAGSLNWWAPAPLRKLHKYIGIKD